MTKIPSPCIDVCKFKRQGHCIGCSMTKTQKSLFKTLKKNAHREALVALVVAQQIVLGRYAHWEQAYRKKCRKKKAPVVISSAGKAA